MEKMLSDTNTYELVRANPKNHQKIISELRALLTRWKSQEYIDQCAYKKLISNEEIISRVYGQKYTRKFSPYYCVGY